MNKKIAEKKIAILGATSHIAKNLIYYFYKKFGYSLYLFGRNINKISEFIIEYDIKTEIINTFEDFKNFKYDVVINCVGFGDPSKLKNAGYELFEITEYYDNLIINYLKQKKETIYINFSSGAVYGNDFIEPANEHTEITIQANNIPESMRYPFVKLYLETKHKSYNNLRIFDLRIFNFFSRFIDLNSSFLICDIIKSIKNKTVFKTDSIDIIRDFAAPEEMVDLTHKIIEEKDKFKNGIIDIRSAAPISKFELLTFLKKKYNLKYSKESNNANVSPTGIKLNYYSERSNDYYFPKKKSLTVIDEETKFFL